MFKELPASYEIPGLRAALEETKRGGAPVTLADIPVRHPGGESTYSISVAPLRDPRERVLAVLITAIDRTDVAEAAAGLEELRVDHADLLNRQTVETEQLSTVNEELRLANETLQEQLRRLQEAELADERKNRFLAMLAHELRNPLGAIGNALHIIRRAAITDRTIARAVRIADRQLRHEARLLDDLLDVSRIVVGKIALRSDVVDLGACARNVVEGTTLAAATPALDVQLDVPREPVTVIGDPARLEQCIANLLDNAVKYSPAAARITVTVRRDDPRAIVTVSDDGVGIAPEMLDRIFDLFTQADATLARSRGGLGIGLTVVRTLIQFHGGTVAARSAGPGRGSEFEIVLPLAAGAVTQPAPPPAARHRPRRILVVDDNRDARETLRGVLELDGHTVIDTGNARDAVRLALESAPEVVLLDIGLPDLDGFEVARQIRARLGHRVRVVAVSGYGDCEAQERGRRAGFDAHLVKPVAPDDLARALAGLFRES